MEKICYCFLFSQNIFQKAKVLVCRLPAFATLTGFASPLAMSFTNAGLQNGINKLIGSVETSNFSIVLAAGNPLLLI
jgi:hypothetical protein